MDFRHRFFDGTPVKARAAINPYRDEVYTETLAAIEEKLQQFHAIKAAFDPQGLLNPGKAVPTLHRCAEFGAMHVHHNQIPFPELERC